ncbi:beta-eliminating lyase [Colletotrichum gloeosporioides Cg-14]|uniref:Beta-eliminating lyase n=1 Tax=Colletotrichum gloeosporioides (strain Cg-14) TaxID=1237896 RepID=T0LR67_COLGC|nr:beta-eliminating lyase [Colletotrichum gloeosporioides Cg-14]
MSQASATTVHPKNGVHLTLGDVKADMIADGNNAQAMAEYMRSFPVPEEQKPVAMDLDAAHLFDGVFGEGADLKAYTACFDSLSICLAKGNPWKQAIHRACQMFRKMFGGGTRQPGMMVAAALEYTLPRMSNVHAFAKKTAAKIEELGYKFALPVQTNMIVLDLAAVDIPAAAFADYCAKHRVSVFPNGRIVFHHQVTDDGVNALVAALTGLVEIGMLVLFLALRRFTEDTPEVIRVPFWADTYSAHTFADE